MLPATLWLLCLAAIEARAQKTTSTSSTRDHDRALTFSGTAYSTIPISEIKTSDFSGSQYVYVSPIGQSTVLAENATTTSSGGQVTRSSSTGSVTLIGGANPTNGTRTASSTSTGPTPKNTVPCNGYPEFCERKYSNITEVCAHNSAFSIPNNAASNQVLSITQQLNDGVRMLQGETHWVNKTIYNCHTSCDLLNAGTWQSSLEVVKEWLDSHPYDVVTWLIVNSDFVSVEKYVPAITNSGLKQYAYVPDYVPQHRSQWPTLADMILTNKRMVFFMDYKANQKKVPYILDEFTHIWETPFSPTNRSFPCTQQRPPGLKEQKAKEDFMYLANHNLNVAVDFGAITGSSSSKSSSEQVLIPNTAVINTTNGMYDQFSQMGAMSLNCTAMWTRPPNFLLVDYFNFGDPHQGSVFEVAAAANNVTYNKQCCGYKKSAAPVVRTSVLVLGAALAFAVLLAW